ncbi:MAG: SDR family oxidoreductase [Candidatus Sericytochromatia bacterium]|uniref:dTDP-4-dehydrorhamnose reductase n=1 Tax=Candidatus Tanganyikabacteria bacterium TaxID=2961651 RepID=A0A938BMF4_9BACT|nr:SDR family oxidoreductase [Candidatus Tanganyikabacteria bacterium]
MSAAPHRILILGAYGMMGHKLIEMLGDRFETWATCRTVRRDRLAASLVSPSRLIPGVVAEDLDSVAKVIGDVRPTVIVNAIGIVKQLSAAKDPVPSLTINALFPHRLYLLARAAGARLIHFSTDCVFSGHEGRYLESRQSDAEDLYGRTKFLGEVAEPGAFTIRSSMIGFELGTATGLIEWFVSQAGKEARGYTHAIYSGLTTSEMARIVTNLISHHPDLSGVWQIASEPISKFDLLGEFNRKAGLDVRLGRDDALRCDRSLDGSRFAAATGYQAPSWNAMIDDLVRELPRYHSQNEFARR